MTSQGPQPQRLSQGGQILFYVQPLKSAWPVTTPRHIRWRYSHRIMKGHCRKEQSTLDQETNCSQRKMW